MTRVKREEANEEADRERLERARVKRGEEDAATSTAKKARGPQVLPEGGVLGEGEGGEEDEIKICRNRWAEGGADEGC